MSLAKLIQLQPSEDTELTGAEELTELLRTKAKELDNIKAEVSILRSQFLAYLRTNCSGKAGTKARVACADGRAVSVSWTAQYKAIDARHEPLMREVLGDSFDQLFEVRASLKARKGLTMDDLESALGEHFATLLRVCEVKPSIAPQPNYPMLRERVGLTLDDETLALIDDVVDSVQYEPRVRLK